MVIGGIRLIGSATRRVLVVRALSSFPVSISYVVRGVGRRRCRGRDGESTTKSVSVASSGRAKPKRYTVAFCCWRWAVRYSW